MAESPESVPGGKHKNAGGRWKRTIMPDPLGEPRNPLAIFVLFLCVTSGTGLLFGVPTAGSVEAELPSWGAHTWGGMLVGGAGAVLTGMFWQGDVRDGLLVKRVGYSALIVSCVIYAACIIVAAGSRGMFAASLTIGFAGACLIQYRKINKVVHRIIRATQIGNGT